MTEFQQLVHEFNVAIQAPSDRALRAELIREEGEETIEAIKAKDPIATIDGLCDLLYVIYGAADVFNLELRHEEYVPRKESIDWVEIVTSLEAFRFTVRKTVQIIRDEDLTTIKRYLESLARKCWITAASGLSVDLVPFFREVHRTNMLKVSGPIREDGKRLKPEGWQPPRIAEMYAKVMEGRQ